MSGTKHTPGPWVEDGGAFYPAWALDEDGYNRKGYIAEMLNGYDESYHANAALIAAAPEMLVALESIAEFWNRDQNWGAMNEACWHAIETAEAAIAKAKGEQP